MFLLVASRKEERMVVNTSELRASLIGELVVVAKGGPSQQRSQFMRGS
jgi:hypothetical protein